MYKLTLLSVVFCIASAQLAAWPGSSYSPYYQALFGPARTPVNSIPWSSGAAHSAIPAPPQIAAPIAVPYAAAPLPIPAPLPVPVAAAPFAMPLAAPVAVPAPTVLRGPAFAYAPSPVLAPVGRVALPMMAAAPIAPAVPVLPRYVPAYAPFATSAMFIGSNKGKKTA